MNMDKTINNNIENLQSNFYMLWKKFTILFPIANVVIKKKELSKFRNGYIKKYKELCDSNINIITSSCLLERFICTFNPAQQAVNFKSEVACIASAIDKALRLSSTDKTLNNKIKDIAKNMFITYDANPSSENNDYRNRLRDVLKIN